MKATLLFILVATAAQAKECQFYTGKDNKIEFTGYKFTEKTGVTGTFKKFEINAPSKVNSVKAVLEGSKFSIDEMSLDAGNAARNSNISKGLLKNIEGTKIQGKVTKVDEAAKKAIVNIKWGGKDHKVEMKYGHDKKKEIIFLDGTIDLIKMGFGKAFNALGKICGPFHKGKDGKIKTWSDVALRAEIGTKVKCN